MALSARCGRMGAIFFSTPSGLPARRTLIFVGICTDICVLNAVLASLSARTRGFLGDVRDIVVFEPGCSTYDLSAQDAQALGLAPDQAHPAALYHAMGLLLMRNQGARIASEIRL